MANKRTKKCRRENCENITKNSQTCLCEKHLAEFHEKKSDHSDKTLGEFKAKHNSSRLRCNIFSRIRQLTRASLKHLANSPCFNCGYTKHSEYCHIRSISSFPDSALISEINSEINVFPLCPNCHWEFDSGLLDKSIADKWIASRQDKTSPIEGNEKSTTKLEQCPYCSELKSIGVLMCEGCRDKKIIPTHIPESSLKKYNYCSCGKIKLKNSKSCSICFDETSLINWPTPEEMKKLIWEIPASQLKERFNCSDNGIEKFCKKHGIDKPLRGYWQKLRAGKLSI